MEKRTREIVEKLRSYAANHFADHFLVIFGSYAYGLAKPGSDIDAICFCEMFGEEQLLKFRDLFYDLSNQFEASLAAEMPHERSLLISYRDLLKAIRGFGFIREKPRTIIVPDMIRTRDYFLSDLMRFRFAFNAITTKNIFVSGNYRAYISLKRQAIKNLIGFLFLINKTSSFELEELIERSITDKFSSRSQGNYLGYKDLPEVRNYFLEAYSEELTALCSERKLLLIDGKYHIGDNLWLENLVCGDDIGR